jgi:hypothetical protein
VDRAALDAALAAGSACGGWCPAGRLAEDGPIPARCPLVELAGAGYLERTLKNVTDSDATLVITFGAPKGGTARTVEFCRRHKRPYLLTDAVRVELAAAVTQAVEFVARNGVARINVAGPRASGEPRAYAYAYSVVAGLLATVGGH